jgi:ferric-dicitrate binding protein FerR (iron transport regulator)
MTLYPSARTLVLSAGQADLEVTPGLPGRFRVTTPRFVVEVLGTRFVVTTESVRTLRGRVVVLDRQNKQLASLTGGANWTLADASAPGASPSVPPEPPKPAPPRDGDERDVGAASAPPRSRSIPASQLLMRSRSALARGESRQARALAQRALAAGPTDRESATGQLLLADAFLVEKRSGEAIEAYRRVVQRWARAPEAEVAQFAVAQLLLERGARAEAEVALRNYLAWYPLGRFVREAREHLSLLRSRP